MKASKSLLLALVCAAVGVSLAWANDEAAGGKTLTQTLDELLPGIAKGDNGAQQQWQEICFKAGTPGNGGERAEVCRAMTVKLADTNATARLWLLAQLERIGRAECVDAVAALLDDGDPLVRDAAQRALANNPAPKAGAKLSDKLKATADNKFKAALIGALGYRAEPAGVAALAGELGSQDAAVAAVAARALGKIATPEAAKALAAARSAARGDVRLRVSDAYLLCADKLLGAGKTAEAAAIYQELCVNDEPQAVRAAAMQGRLRAAGNRAAAIILEVLAGNDANAQKVAVRFTGQIDTAGVQTLAAGLAKLPPVAQVALLSGLGPRRDRAALPAVVQAVGSADPAVKLAALNALAGLADASTVGLLVETIQAGGEPGDAARRSLVAVFAPGVNEKLIATMKQTEEPGQRARLIDILEQRRAAVAAPALLQVVVGPDAGVRRAAMKALGQVAGPEHVAGMILGLAKTADVGEREEAERAITLVCVRVADESKQADPVLAVIARADEAEKTALLSVLGRIGGAKALDQVRAALGSNDADRYEAAVRAICNWPDATVAEDLLKLAAGGKEESQRVRAVRALARVLVLEGGPSDQEKVALLKRTIEQASRNEERDLILDRARALRHIDTVRLVAAYLDNPDQVKRACETLVDLAHQGGLRGPNQAEFDRVLKKVIEVAPDRKLAEQAKQYMSKP